MNQFEKLYLTNEQLTFVKNAYQYARTAHRKLNHKYDGKDYFDTHILRTVHYAMKYIYLVPKEDRHYALAIQFLHDGTEDAHLTYNDIKKVLGYIVAEGAFACQNEKGRTRAERANAKYYKGIRETYLADFVKLADRMGNLDYGLFHGGGMIDGYRKENDHFVKSIEGRANLWGRVSYWFNEFMGFESIVNISPMIQGLNDMLNKDYIKSNYDDFKIGDYQWVK